ncbi:MAG: phage tail tape measure protein [Paenibacillaceae bacterium]|nr:phage tail tape measure protein [Paenibacillaceae bacterium]
MSSSAGGGIPDFSKATLNDLNKLNKMMSQLQKTTSQLEQVSGFARIGKELEATQSTSAKVAKQFVSLQLATGATAGIMRKKLAAMKPAVDNFMLDLSWAVKAKAESVSKGAKALGKPFAGMWQKVQDKRAASAKKKADDALAAKLGFPVGPNAPPKLKGIKRLQNIAGNTAIQNLPEDRKKMLSSAASTAGSLLGQLQDRSLAAAKEFSTAVGTLRGASMAGPGQMKGMVASLRELGGQVPQNLNEIASVMGTLSGKAKLTGTTLTAMSKTVLDASRLSGANSAEAANAAASVMSVWGKKAGEGTLMMDQFFAASRVSGAGMGDLLKNMGSLGLPLQQMGLSFEQSMALMAKWQSAGLTPIQDALRKDVKGEGLAAITAKIKAAATESEAAALAAQYFGHSVSGDLVAALKNGQVEFGGVVAAMSTAGNAIRNQAGEVQTFGDKWDMLQNRITVALAPLGEAMLPLGEALASIVEVLTRDGDIVLATIGSIAALLLGVFAPALWASAVAGWAAVAPFLPIIAAVLLVGVAVAGLAYVFKYHMDWIVEQVNKVKDKISSFLSVFDIFIGDENGGAGGNTATSNGGPPTSRYHGMSYVPYDGMMARLHKGERIMTAAENREFSNGASGGAAISITGNTFHVRQESDIDAIARALAREIKAAGGLMA